jgi:hypothetical protein
MSIDLKNKKISIKDIELNEGDVISLDGNSGNVYECKLDIAVYKPTLLLDEIERWKGTQK